MATTEVKVEKIPWVPLLLVILVYCFFAPIWGLMLPSGATVWYGITRSACHMILITGAYLLILLAMGLRSLKPFKERISVAALTYLYAIGASVGYIGVIDGFPIVDWYIPMLSDRVVNPVLSQKFWPEFWAPPAATIEQMLSGGVMTPWGEWLPSILWWGTLFAVFAVCTTSVANILRRAWIDVEKVPFPQTMVAHDLIVRGTAEKSLKERLGLPFLVGLLIGVVFEFPLFMTYAFPWFPDIYGWRANTCATGNYWVPTSSPLAGIVFFGALQKHPIYMAVFYLVPLSISFNVWFWAMVATVLTQVAYVMGYYTGITSLDGCGRYWCGTNTIWKGEPFKWNVMSGVGMVLGMFVMYFVLNRGYVIGTLRAALGMLPTERIRDMERDEPTTYRTAYATFLISFVLLAVLMMFSGVSVIPAFLMIITGLIWMFVAIRVFGLAGLGFPCGGHFGTAMMKTYFGEALPEPMTREWMISVSGLTRYPFCQGLTKGFGAGFVGGFSSYRLASLTGTSTKNVYKVVLVTTILAPFLANAGFIWACNTWGLTRLPTISGYAGTSYIDGWANATDASTDPAPVPWLPQAAAGFIAAVVLSYLHGRFIWFPFEPIGLFIATEEWGTLTGIWTMFLAAWILKVLTLRIGGSKAYEEYGVPIATGFIAGFVIVALLGGAALDWRFFFPY
jgi:hypothetical protein